MTTHNNGGPAFPGTQVAGGSDGIGQKDGIWHLPGMTLRDYFAAKAMQGLLSDPAIMGTPREFAERAYSMADAMLWAREAT